jgi:hypothetical protein
LMKICCPTGNTAVFVRILCLVIAISTFSLSHFNTLGERLPHKSGVWAGRGPEDFKDLGWSHRYLSSISAKNQQRKVVGLPRSIVTRGRGEYIKGWPIMEWPQKLAQICGLNCVSVNPKHSRVF